MSGMLGQRVGYVRVSTLDQRTERQLGLGEGHSASTTGGAAYLCA
jgi:hypothetical protein